MPIAYEGKSFPPIKVGFSYQAKYNLTSTAMGHQLWRMEMTQAIARAAQEQQATHDSDSHIDQSTVKLVLSSENYAMMNLKDVITACRQRQIIARAW